MGSVKCPECFNTIVDGQDMCFKCGTKLPPNMVKPNPKRVVSSKANTAPSPIRNTAPQQKISEPNYSIFSSVDKYKDIKNNFDGIYRYDRNGNKKSEVICPRCNSWNCGFYQQEQTKTQYKANLNPLKPFTYVNKKEVTRVLERYICNNCGKIFD